MFNNIIYFIVVLLIFHISYPEKETEKSLFLNIGLIFACWAVFCVYCMLVFRRFILRLQRGAEAAAGIYHGLVFRLSVSAVILFGLDVFVFQLKLWILQIPGVIHFEVIQGLIAVAVFMLYLSTIWYFSWPAYKLIFQSGIKRSSFIVSNQKLNFPVLFPWVILTLFIDLISLSPWKGAKEFLDHPAGMVLFFSCFLVVLMIFLPVLIQYWWGCTPLKDTEQTRDIRMFLDNMGFQYRELVNWPVFEGRMMTAGIMGIVSRFRYILVTESLMNNLSNTELKAVMAHEAGHAKYRHQLLYVFLFLGFFIIMMGLFDPQFYLVAIYYILSEYSVTGISGNILITLSAVPVMVILVVYFRFVIGFFMRHFERQADIFSAVSMGDASPTISALEKIGILSGKIRDLPSWHHFSIRERVEFLQKSFENPALIRRHNSLLLKSFLIYIIFASGVIYLSYFTQIRDHITWGMVKNNLSEQLLERPDDPDLLIAMAGIYIDMERHAEACEIYERLLSAGSRDAEVLNNLAWLLITTPDEGLKDYERGLRLAKEATALERVPAFLDTLAEAYWVNRENEKAIEVIKEAIKLADEGDRYLRKQLEKFSGSMEEKHMLQ